MRNLILILLFSVTCFALNTVDRQEIPSYNMIINGGFENGLRGWAESGGGTLAKDTTTELIDKVSATFDASADTDYLYSADYTIPKGLLSAPCEVYMKYQWDSGTAGQIQMRVLDGSDNIIITTTDSSGTDPLAVTSSGAVGEIRRNFSCPSSGTLQFQLYANANAAEITVDSAYLGSARNVGSVDGGTLYGALKWETTANCSWVGTTSGSYANFPVDADCDDNARVATGRTTSIVTAGDAEGRLPQIKFASLPAGEYLIMYSGDFGVYDASANYLLGGWRISDGTNRTQPQITQGSGATGALQQGTGLISGRIRYETAQSNVTFNLQQRQSSADSMIAYVTNGEMEISVYRFPLASETTYNLDTSNQYAGMTMAGALSCTFTSTSATYENKSAVAACNTPTYYGKAASAGKIAGFTVPSIPVGTYMLVANGYFSSDYATSSTGCNWQISDGITNSGQARAYSTATSTFDTATAIVGIFDYSSVQGSTTFQVQFQRDTGGGNCRLYNHTTDLNFTMQMIPITQNLPMPTIMNTVVSPDSDGVRVASALILNAGSASVSREDGDWISSVNRSAAGQVQVNVTSGIFSAAPNCTLEVFTVGGNEVTEIAAASTSQISTIIHDSGTTAGTDEDFMIICIGKK